MTKPQDSLPVSSASPSSQPDAPVFRCLVYLRQLESGKVQATVANLEGFQIEADSERSALMRIVPAFKKKIAEFKTSGQPIPWLDPPTPMDSDQQQRVVPIHL